VILKLPLSQTSKKGHLKNLLSFFFYIRRTGRWNRSWMGWYQWEGRGGREMVKEGEYGAKTLYTCM
jgi:hypothetical protein